MYKHKKRNITVAYKDQICITYALGFLYQFIQDNIGDIKTELERLGYANIITLERIMKLKDELEN